MKELSFFPGNEHLLYVIEDSRKLTKIQERNLIAETSKLSNYFQQHIYHDAGNRSMKKNIQQVQHIVYWLLEKIYTQQQTDATLLRDEIAFHLCNFLQFLQKHSGKWFDYDAAMPRLLWLPVQEQFCKFLQNEQNNVTDIELLQVINDVFITTTSVGSVSYSDAIYWQKLMEALQHKQPYTEGKLSVEMYTLLRFNFNHSLFLHHLFNYYATNICLSDKPALYWLQAFQEINRIVPVSGFSLLKEEEDCKKCLLRMFRNEINADQFCHEPSVVMEQNLPYEYNLTISQLAVYFRMLVDSGTIKTNNLTEMLRHFTKHAVSNRAATISPKSLYNNYHQPDRAAVHIMMEYNTRMRNVLMGLLK